MTYVIPNYADAGFADQAEPDARDFGDILAASLNLTGVVSGCAVTAQGSPDMTVAVASGSVVVAGTAATVTSGNVTITTADGTNPRFDLICVDSAGTKSAVAGTASSNPVFPDPSGKCVIAAVYVPASDTAINSNQITDKRLIIKPWLQLIGGTMTGTLTVQGGGINIDRDGASALFQGSAYGSGFFATTNYRMARGTLAAPLRAKLNDVLGRVGASGGRAADDVSAATFPGAAKAHISFLAAEDQTTGANGMQMSFYTTPVGTTTPAEQFRIGAAGTLSLVMVAGTQSISDELGTGLNWGTIRTPLRWGLAVGSDASPATAAGNPLKISKTENIATGTLTSDQSSDENAALSVYSRGLATSQVQVAAVAAFARTLSTQSGNNDDSNAVWGVGIVAGSGTGNGIGGYLHGRCESGTNASAGALGLEARVENFKAEDHSYNSTGFSKSTGIWITAYDNGNTRTIGVGLAIGRFGSTAQYDVGLGFNASVIKTATIRDDSSSITVFDINGTHTTGLDMAGATLTNGILLPNNAPVKMNDSGATLRSLINLDASNIVTLGDAAVSGYKITLPTTNSDTTASGVMMTFTAGETLARGDVVYMKSDGKLWKADADSVTTAPVMGIATAAITANNPGVFMLVGTLRDDTAYNWTVGGLLYLSQTTGGITQTQPASTDDVIQVLGVALTADIIYFNPDLSYITHT